MKKVLFILAFSNMLTSELILEITQGTEDPYRVAILKFEGDQKVSNDIDKIIRNKTKNIKDDLYLHKSTTPLDEVDLEEKNNQIDLFNDICDEAVCGV